MIDNMTLKDLKDFCKQKGLCYDCPYFEDYNDDAYNTSKQKTGECYFKQRVPMWWDIKEEK